MSKRKNLDIQQAAKKLRKTVSLTITELETRGKPVVRDQKGDIVTVHWTAPHPGRLAKYGIGDLEAIVGSESEYIYRIAHGMPIMDLGERLQIAEAYLILDLAYKFRNERARLAWIEG